jgi:hypothetical protein
LFQVVRGGRLIRDKPDGKYAIWLFNVISNVPDRKIKNKITWLKQHGSIHLSKFVLLRDTQVPETRSLPELTMVGLDNEI